MKSKKDKDLLDFTDILSNIASYKSDRKERSMEKEDSQCPGRKGKYLPVGHRKTRAGRWIAGIMLLFWDGLLLYMIAENLIDPVYGAAFTAAVSVYFGYKI